MEDRGLLPDFSHEALKELDAIDGPALETGGGVEDMRGLLWCSVDNDDSRDLDQLSVGEDLGGGMVRIRVAVADVDGLVPLGSAIDEHARQNTASLYVAGQVYPMVPERLSTDLTSLNPKVDRMSLVFSYAVDSEGALSGEGIARAVVHNHAQLAYNSVAAWLDGHGPLPNRAADVPGMDAQLRLQEGVAQVLRHRRHQEGALDLESIEARPIFHDDMVVGLKAEKPNRAKWMIEEFMIAANGVVARFLENNQRPSLRRVVRSPERWAKLVLLAEGLGETLPNDPDAKALEGFLVKRRAADPIRFPDLSLSVVKLMGAGEYVAENAGDTHLGHFGLSVKDYAHATAPNRRYPDLITQRLLKATLAGEPPPYSFDDLALIARHCSLQENSIAKVQRQVHKSAAVLLLEQRIGERFEGLVTGAAEKGTWVRLFDPPVEGRLVYGAKGLRVGDKLRVRLEHTNFERGYLDFSRIV